MRILEIINGLNITTFVPNQQNMASSFNNYID